MKPDDRKGAVIAILGSAVTLMLLVGCAGDELQSRTDQEAADITLQSQQNIEEDLSDGLSQEQSEASEQLERSEEAEQSEETGQLLNEEADDQGPPARNRPHCSGYSGEAGSLPAPPVPAG